MYQEPKKLAELQLGVRNFCGDFNARNKEKKLLVSIWMLNMWMEWLIFIWP